MLKMFVLVGKTLERRSYKFPNILDQFLSRIESSHLDLSHFCPHIHLRHFQKFHKKICPDSPEEYSDFRQILVRTGVNFPGPRSTQRSSLKLSLGARILRA